MKNTITIAGGGVRMCSKSVKPAAVTVCHNLRPERRPTGQSVLRPTGTPIRISDSACRPLTTMAVDGHNYLAASSGCKLYLIDTTPVEAAADTVTATTPQCLTLDGEPQCALASGNRLTVMTSRRVYRYRLSGGVLTECDMSAMPSISLTAEAMPDTEVSIGSRTLSRSYPAGNHSMTESDLRALSDDMRRSYITACHQAKAADGFIAPMLCRWRVVGKEGETLLEGPPLLLGTTGSERLTAPLIISSTDRRTTSPCVMSLPTWRPSITLNGAVPQNLSDIVDRIEVVAMAVFHAYDSNEKASVTTVWTQGSDDFLRMTAPGAWKALSPNNASPGRARLSLVAGRNDIDGDVIAILRLGDSSMQTTVSVSGGGVEAECHRTENIVNTKGMATDTTLSRLMPPHSFTAGCVATASGTELWGRLTAHRFAGYKAETFAASRAGTGAWHAAVSISFGDGSEQTVATSEGLSGAPLSFNPLLSYPSAEATAMTIIVSAAGEVRRATYPLTPCPSGNMAIYIHPTLQAHKPGSTVPAFAVPPERSTDHPMESFVCGCVTPSSAGQRIPLAVMPVSDGRVTTVMPWGRNSTGWESSGVRYAVLSDAGTHRAVLSPVGRQKLTLSLIDSDKAPGEHCATEAEGSLLCVVGRRLVKIGTRGVTTIADNIEAESAAYVAATGELWVGTTQGVRVVTIDSMEWHSRDHQSLGASAGCYAELDGQLVDLSRESTGGSRYVRWSGEIKQGDRYRRLSGMSLDLKSGQVSNTSLTLRRVNHDKAEDRASCRLTASGRIAAPLAARCLSLPTRGCAFDFQGRVSADTIVSSIKIEQS